MVQIMYYGLKFGRYEIAKEVWDLLAARYTTSDLSSQYQLWEELHNLKQERGESTTSFYAKMQALWDQLALSEPTFNDTADIGKYIEHRDKMSLVECHKCKQKGHIAPNCTTPLPQRSDQFSKLVVAAAAANEDTSIHPSIGNLETLFRQMISSSSTSTALPTIPGSTDGTYSWDRSPSHQTPIFTNPSLELFPNDDVESLDELSNDQTTMVPVLEDVFSADIAPGTNEIESPSVASSSSHLIRALEKTCTWDLVDLPTDKTLVGCNSTVSEFGFTSSPHDTALFICKSAQGMVLLLIYVDDMIITGDDVLGIDELKQFLSHRFEMKDLDSLSYFLGLKVTSSDDGYLLSQVKYASDLVSKASLTDSKIVSTPFEPNVKLTTLDGSPLPDATCC
ncbi:hypothetical protein SLEP1_g6006 [Rubroshorea leprosula]|uniref:CCHC-type domain-containing protein n=1 Tax=Rubroshorea leprosula TaxID=152421 RepID=A0AAV5HTT1_9ROSI|nr:hypothetical protein SLEP1_g6006 [Rubroshorea leprosula]